MPRGRTKPASRRRRFATPQPFCALFNMIVRLADSLGWDVPDWERLQQRAPAMLEGGYALTALRRR